MPRGGRLRNYRQPTTVVYKAPLTNKEIDTFEGYYDIDIRDLVWSAKWIAFRGTGQSLKLSSMLGRQREFETMVSNWIKSYELKLDGFAVFQNHWKRVRPWLDLQTRLAIEQIFYDKGKPYSGLVSGFRPLG